MSIIEAIILGIIQGLTEFIPISSTAHLTIAGDWLGLIDPNNPERWTSFIATVQLGTLAAVFVYFKKEIKEVPTAFLKENIAQRKKFSLQSSNSRLGWLIIIGSIPVIIVGLLFKDFIEGAFTKDLQVIAISLIVLGILLAISEKAAKHKKDLEKITILDSILIGIAQCFALIPGSSRSGTTITGGLFSGLKRETAARFSFLLGIPAIFGSGVLSFYQSLEYIKSDELLTLIIATIFSGISGYFAIAFLLKFLKTRTTFLFVYYRVALGAIILIFIKLNII